jgi:hypothetical protein
MVDFLKPYNLREDENVVRGRARRGMSDQRVARYALTEKQVSKFGKGGGKR